MALAKTHLEQKVLDRIQREGRITFRDFMEAALYDPEFGYYNTARIKIGPEGDYFTSSNVHPAFGAVLADAFAEMCAGSSLLTIVEFGAGTGQLACDVLATMRDEHPRLFDDLTYLIVETSPVMRRSQRDKLSPFAEKIRWVGLEELGQPPLRAIAFSNEFIDAMPVHRARFNAGALEESYVSLAPRGSKLAEVWAHPTTDRLGEYVERMGITPRDNFAFEINLDAVDWLSRIAGALESGYLVTIDYGDLVGPLWSERPAGTLRSFHHHRLIDSPFDRVGAHDMTASVNFSALIDYGKQFGLELVSYERQARFLIRMGLIERIAAGHAPQETLDDLKQRLAVKNLFAPGGISDSFRVLIQRKGGPHP
jgi:SAM-dependent MidA family methyltransferase